MQGKDYSLPMWVETDISKFVSGRLHYCNTERLSPPAGFQPVGFAAKLDDLSNNISVTLGKSTIRQSLDVWMAYLDSTHIHPENFCWPRYIDEEPFNPTDGELTIEFTGMPVSEGVREFAKQYLREFKVEEKLTHGDSTAVTTKY